MGLAKSKFDLISMGMVKKSGKERGLLQGTGCVKPSQDNRKKVG